jgi:hypothetical protein
MEELRNYIQEALKNLEGIMETGSSASFHSYDSGRHDTYLIVLGWIDMIESNNGEVSTEV